LEELGQREQHPEHRKDRDRSEDHPPTCRTARRTAPGQAAADHPVCE
jgi:hypothetical protein